MPNSNFRPTPPLASDAGRPGLGGVASDIRRGAAWFALPLAGASLVRLALEPQYWSGIYLAWLAVISTYGVLQWRILREPDPARIRLALLTNLVAIGVGYVMIGACLGRAAGWRADAALYRVECAVFGRDPQQFLAPWRAPWLSTVAILGYISFVGFLLYLFLAEGRRLGSATGRLQLRLMRIYGIGYSCYILFPAAGPAFHHPGLLAPYAQPPFVAYLNSWVVRCCSRVDVWPSLHAAVCCFALFWSFRRDRRAFCLLILPGAALMFGAVYLQYHYFIDMAAGCLLCAACLLPLSQVNPQAAQRIPAGTAPS